MQPKTRRSLPFRISEWRWVELTIAAFVFIPELRRLADWRGSYDPLNTFAVIPLLMLCPIAAFAFKRRAALMSAPFSALTLLWGFAFGYGFLVALLHGSIVPAVYSAALFVLPTVVGFWILTLAEPFESVYRRFARMLLVYGLVAGLYGVFQFVVAPPWDTAWMQNTNANTFGTPVRFGIRVFGVLNSPGPYAFFLMAVMLLNLPFLRIRNAFSIGATAVMTVGIALSLVRSSWIALGLGILIYLIVTPKRAGAALGISAIAGAASIVFAAFLVLVPGSDFSTTLAQRIGSLGSVSDDGSTADRRQTSLDTLNTAIDQPLGAGLGLTGGSAKLGSADEQALTGAPSGSIDNGFVSRFFEMGFVGIVAFSLSGFFAIVVTFRAYRSLMKSKDYEVASYAAACASTVLVIFVLNLSGDGQQGLLGTLYFSACALALAPANALRREQSSARTDQARRIFA